MRNDVGFNHGRLRQRRNAFRLERRLALIFALLGALLTGLIAGYWVLTLEPALRQDAESRAHALAQAQARGIEDLLGRDLPPALLLDELKTRLDAILLLKERDSGQPLTNRILLVLNPDWVALPPEAMTLQQGDDRQLHSFVTEVPLYHPQRYALMGMATFYANRHSLETLLADVRIRLFGIGALVLLFIVAAWFGVAWLLRRLSQSEANLRNLLEVAPIPILLLEPDGNGIQLANQAAAIQLGLVPDAAGGLHSPAWAELVESGLPRAKDGQREVQLSTGNDETHWTIVSTSEVSLSGNEHRLVSLVDVSELKAVQQRLHQAANTDELTQAYNRRYLFTRLNEEIAVAERNGTALAVILFDLDRFKGINDGFGHAVGDEVLVRSAEIMRQCIRGSDLCGRYGGEELLVILPSASRTDAVEIAERIRRAIKAERWSRPALQVTISGGIGVYHGDTVDTLLERADRCLYRAKREGRDRIVASDEP
ncbi:diguanylate cyclase [Thiohalocapsa marina]|uniref:diguanylate cyclase n=1 Tax=Thiohalocapsa marina TaxID=424902 RepID=A0A5M8FJD0_9GAMM|nr:sensor domain-containing diguanylate cyclase [Thiohalocapsa marina]KAA6183846.1 diguanylate cyclase [Thiohalocapsa marina]